MANWFTSIFSGRKKSSESSRGVFGSFMDSSVGLFALMATGLAAGRWAQDYVVNPRLKEQVQVVSTTVQAFAEQKDTLGSTYEEALIALKEANALSGAGRNDDALKKYNEAETKLKMVQAAVNQAKISYNIGGFVKTAQSKPGSIIAKEPIMGQAAQVVQQEQEFQTQTTQQLQQIATLKAALKEKVEKS